MASAGGRQHSQSRAIPARPAPHGDAASLPPGCCTTPGGTLFSTTPGGTRIIYDRKFLLERRNSPMAQTPPCQLPDIPGVTSPGAGDEPKAEPTSPSNQDGKPAAAGELPRKVPLGMSRQMARPRGAGSKGCSTKIRNVVFLMVASKTRCSAGTDVVERCFRGLHRLPVQPRKRRLIEGGG
uniref:Eukaryotic translation initiation factor 4E binding protein 2 n=1 Tax=Pavo cristatus TaxID=9049 RepID=A0A8C9FXM1_PAVCR